MKKQGFSIIEVTIVTAIMGIIMLMFSPLIRGFLGAQDRIYATSKVDSRLNEVVEFIKRDAKNAKTAAELGNEPIGVFDEYNNLITDGKAGKKVIIKTINLDGQLKFIQYTIKDGKLLLRSTNSFTTNVGGIKLLNGIEDGSFRYKDKILLFHFKIQIPARLEGKVRNEVRDIAITRVNF